jgi:hypothetical protein
MNSGVRNGNSAHGNGSGVQSEPHVRVPSRGSDAVHGRDARRGRRGTDMIRGMGAAACRADTAVARGGGKSSTADSAGWISWGCGVQTTKFSIVIFQRKKKKKKKGLLFVRAGVRWQMGLASCAGPLRIVALTLRFTICYEPEYRVDDVRAVRYVVHLRGCSCVDYQSRRALRGRLGLGLRRADSADVNSRV